MYLHNCRSEKMKKISIVYGGRSTEHDASLKSKETIASSIDKTRFEIDSEVFIDRKGKIFVNSKEYSLGEFVELVKERKDVFFINLLHGNEGEDGSWCGIFDICDGNGSFESVMTSAILMDKAKQSDCVSFSFDNLKCPKTSSIFRNQNKDQLKTLIEKVGTERIIVKPNKMGASHLTEIFESKNVEKISKFLDKIFEFDEQALIQEFIQGDEYTCGVIIKDNKPISLPVIKVKTNTGFLSHTEKHTHGDMDIRLIDDEITKKVQKISEELMTYFYIKGMCRFDFLYKDETFYFLEGNTLPGLSSGSAFPRMLEKAGFDTNDLIDCLVKSFSKQKKDNKYLPYKID